MRFKLRNIGNSIGIIFPQHWLQKYHLSVGDELVGHDGDKFIVLTPYKEKIKYSLKDLVAQSTNDNFTAEDVDWLNMNDFGEEKVW
jgi:antitoxin component of MazEF toxin-antitoxin module